MSSANLLGESCIGFAGKYLTFLKIVCKILSGFLQESAQKSMYVCGDMTGAT